MSFSVLRGWTPVPCEGLIARGFAMGPTSRSAAGALCGGCDPALGEGKVRETSGNA